MSAVLGESSSVADELDSDSDGSVALSCGESHLHGSDFEDDDYNEDDNHMNDNDGLVFDATTNLGRMHSWQSGG